MLDTNKTLFLRERARKLPPGGYELSTVYGLLRWNQVDRPTEEGRRAKQTVLAGLVPGLTVGLKTATNHQLYVVG